MSRCNMVGGLVELWSSYLSSCETLTPFYCREGSSNFKGSPSRLGFRVRLGRHIRSTQAGEGTCLADLGLEFSMGSFGVLEVMTAGIHLSLPLNTPLGNCILLPTAL